MNWNRIIAGIGIVFLCIHSFAGPSRNITYILTQPDGTTFSSVIRGDEYLRIKTTSDGYAIVQDPDGWWSYAVYDEDGRKLSTGYHVGGDVPSAVLSDSRVIPYTRLRENSSSSRMRMMPRRQPLPMTKASSGQVRCPVILVQYQDVKFRSTRQDFEDLLNKRGYNRNGADGSASDYFNAQFSGAVNFVFDVFNIVTLPENRDYYGENVDDGSGNESDKAAEDMVLHACRILDSNVDFARYDSDNDGFVDFVYIFFAGGDEAQGYGDNTVWPHQWALFSGADKQLDCDGKRIDRYACSAELMRIGRNDAFSGIGTFCHEFSHILGLYDMYDTDYEGSGGESDAVLYSSSLMASGNYNNNSMTPPYYNAVDREIIGLQKPTVITANGTYSLEPISRSGQYFRIDTDNEDEYYLIECRLAESWDTYIGGSGLLVYHVDKSDRDAGYSDTYGMNMTASERWYYNEVNCRPDHPCVYMLSAIPDSRESGAFFFPVGEYNSIASESMPYWSGTVGDIYIEGIRRSGEKIVFNVLGFKGGTKPPEPVRIGYERFQDAAIISFESSFPYGGKADVSWGVTGRETSVIQVEPYESGKYAVVLEDLNPKTSYTVTVSFTTDGVTGKEGSISFMTSSGNAGYPYIYMKNVQRNPDGTFPYGCRLPLRTYNSVDSEKVTWSFNGKEIKTDASGYYKVTEGGTLKASVYWEDGSTDILVKEIIVK